MRGGRGSDVMHGGRGNDHMFGGRGPDILFGGPGNDRMEGGRGRDVLFGGEDNDRMNGGADRDFMDGGHGNDNMRGGRGNDSMLDGAGDDNMRGGAGNDSIANGYGNDRVHAGAGDDRIISFSDAGEPDIAQGGERVNPGEPYAHSNDVLRGGGGANTFYFQLNIDAQEEIIAKHTDANTGRVNWQGVAGENGAPHKHWVDSIGDDKIMNFDADAGDKIVIEGHTVSLSFERVGAGRKAYTLITLTSDQGGAGAHDGDPLGTIRVYGDEVTADDVVLNTGVFYGEDTFAGRMPVYGTEGADEIADGRGSQVLHGGGGNDVLIAYGDNGEPVPAQDAGGKFYEDSPAIENNNDLLMGGDGGDTFLFMPLINAQPEIIDQYRNDDGTIDWQGVAGENGAVHTHWVEGVGDDVIYDYNEADGDTIVIKGHTVNITVEQFDSTDDADDAVDYSVITVYSNQGGAGAHDGDPLGTITVYGDLVDEGDVTVDAGVFYGIDLLDGTA